MQKKKVFVSGCYDMLHSGHVAFFQEAAAYGDLYVGIGSDKTIYTLKNREPFNKEQERLYMVKSIKYVTDAWINQGEGFIDFLDEIKKLKPEIYFVNSDGHSRLKENLCKELGIEYIIGKRVPHADLPRHSTTDIRKECRIPYRIDLAGGWLDQPFVNEVYPGPVLTICIEPDYEFNDRSGMATSSRKKAIELWSVDIPAGDKEKLAKSLFCFENPPGSKYISGSQDAIGIVMPGLSKLNYDNGYWPVTIENKPDTDILDWLEKHLYLVPLYPRHDDFDVLNTKKILKENVIELSKSSNDCWDAILKKNLDNFGSAFLRSFKAQIALFPDMLSLDIKEIIEQYKNKVLGVKLCGAGGGGYLCMVSRTPIDNSMQIRIRRNH